MLEAWAIRLLFAALAAAAAWGHGFSAGKDYVQGKWDAAATKAEREASANRERQRETEEKLRIDHAKTITAVNARLADALEQLRQRPERLPESAATACAGATGRELSAPDAGFLVREAARADRLRAALSECYAVIDAAGEVSGEVRVH